MLVRIALLSSAVLLGVAAIAYAGPAQESDDKPKPKAVAPMTAQQLSASHALANARGLASGDDKGEDKGGDKGGGKKTAAGFFENMSPAAASASTRRLASGDDKGEDKGDKGGGKKLPGATTFSPATLQTTQQNTPTPQ